MDCSLGEKFAGLLSSESGEQQYKTQLAVGYQQCPFRANTKACNVQYIGPEWWDGMHFCQVHRQQPNSERNCWQARGQGGWSEHAFRHQRKELTETTWSSTKANCCTWDTTDLKSSTAWASTGWRAALQKQTWGSWWNMSQQSAPAVKKAIHILGHISKIIASRSI